MEGARRAAERSLALYRRAGDEAGVATALCAVAANGLLGEPNLELVRAAAAAAYQHASTVGDEYLMAKALAVLTPALPPSERQAALREAEILLLRLGNRRELAVSYSNTAYMALLEGRCEEALGLAETAMAAAEACENPNVVMFTAANLGVAALLSGDFRRARVASADSCACAAGTTSAGRPPRASPGLPSSLSKAVPLRRLPGCSAPPVRSANMALRSS